MVELIVQLNEGKIKGCVGENFCGETIYKFLGVPYGKAPIGELRFKAPQPVDPWEEIKDATRDGSACYNRDTLHEHNEAVQGGENCLVLNVFTKNIDKADDLKPVMVYIHGGGFMSGCNKSEIYGPELLLKEDIVVVVINYRLGLFGFLTLEDESLDVPGNAGLKDQTLALKWVQKNIKAFGGDPNNVTIFGESAGSSAVHFHVLSPTSKGLFHKAILQSGAAISSWVITQSNGSVVATALGKTGATDQEVYDILKNMTGEDVFDLQEKIPDLMLFGKPRSYGPVVEKPNATAFITKHPFDLITSGEYNHVPLFFGYTSHEGLLMEVLRRRSPELDKYYTFKSAIPWMLKPTTEQVDEIVQLMSNFYLNAEDPRTKDMSADPRILAQKVARNIKTFNWQGESFNVLMMDSTMLSTIAASILNHSKTSKCPVYVFRISVSCKRNFFKNIHDMQALEGTCHADELGFLWNIQSLPKIEQNTLEYLTAKRFVTLWTNFAKSGNPTPSNDFGVTLSPVKDEKSITVLDIGEKLTVLKDLPERDRVELWKKIFSISHETVNYL